MVSLITGGKGSGKTKKLLELITKALGESKGDIVAIEKGSKMRFDLDHKVRLVDSDCYKIKGYDSLLGFLSGICAGNYDVTHIFLDSTLKICNDDLEGLSNFIIKLNALSEYADTDIGLTLCLKEDEIPENVKAISNIN